MTNLLEMMGLLNNDLKYKSHFHSFGEEELFTSQIQPIIKLIEKIEDTDKRLI